MGVKPADIGRIGPEPEAFPYFVRHDPMGEPLFSSVGFTLVSGTAYWIYMGYLVHPLVVKYLAYFMATAGSGAQTAEFAIASAPTGPNKAAKSLTPVVATGSLGSLVSGSNAVRRNSAAFTTVLSPGLHYYRGFRVANATTQPAGNAGSRDMGRGIFLVTLAATALTVGVAQTGSLLTPSASTNEVPWFWPEID